MINIFAISGLAFGAFVCFVVVMRVNRRMARRGKSPTIDSGFDIADLHDMMQAGTISAEEFDRLTAATARQRGVSSALPASGKRGFDVLPPQQSP
jgi:hypothetical protein